MEAALQDRRGLTAPLDWDSPFKPERISNHPVAVDWYEAAAFARWLEGLRRAGALTLPHGIPQHYVIRLSDEAEREWAALSGLASLPVGRHVCRRRRQH